MSSFFYMNPKTNFVDSFPQKRKRKWNQVSSTQIIFLETINMGTKEISIPALGVEEVTTEVEEVWEETSEEEAIWEVEEASEEEEAPHSGEEEAIILLEVEADLLKTHLEEEIIITLKDITTTEIIMIIISKKEEIIKKTIILALEMLHIEEEMKEDLGEEELWDLEEEAINPVNKFKINIYLF